MAGTRGIDVNVSFPGELVAVELIGLVRDIVAGMDAETRKKVWAWVIADVERWRKFWGVDADDEHFKTLRDLLGLDDDGEPGG